MASPTDTDPGKAGAAGSDVGGAGGEDAGGSGGSDAAGSGGSDAAGSGGSGVAGSAGAGGAQAAGASGAAGGGGADAAGSAGAGGALALDEGAAFHGVLLTVAYDGGAFHGWAPQKDLATVSGELLRAVQAMDVGVVELRGASRTDAGVHSRGQLVAFDATKLVSSTGWCRGLSSKLPPTVSVRAARSVPFRFSPRFSSMGKRYIYTVLCDRFRDPFHDPFSWRIAKDLDLVKMRRAAASILGSHDFAAYRSSADQRESTFRTLHRIDIAPDPADPRLLRFTVEGTGFLHNMVRILVGTLTDIGADKRAEGALVRALETKSRADLGTTAPAEGLLLDEVFLDPGAFEPGVVQPFRSPRGAQLPENFVSRGRLRQTSGAMRTARTRSRHLGPIVLAIASTVLLVQPASAEGRGPRSPRAKAARPEPIAAKAAAVELKPALSAPSAKALGDTFAAVAEKVSAGVVQIDVATRATAGVVMGEGPSDRALPHRRGTGSGVVLSAAGAILTNDHVIENAEAITVRLADGRQLPATIAGRDPEADLAVLRVDARDLSPVKFADSDAARVGEWVVAIGSPYGFGHSVTAGVLSAKGRGGLGATAEEDFLQTDASIHPGNSGGPLVTLDGQVVGINTMIVGQGGSGSIGFAVPSNLARRIADKLLAHGKVERPFVGMHLQEVTPELADELGVPAVGGALVSSVASGGPAEKGNVKAGDVVVESGGKRVSSAHELVRDLLSHEPEAEVPLVVVRAGKRYQTKLTLAPRQESARPRAFTPAPRTTSGLGLVLRDRVEPSGLAGSFVVDVVPGSPADRAGMRAGDLVVEADGKGKPDNAAMTEAARDGKLLLRVRRGERQFFAALRREGAKS